MSEPKLHVFIKDPGKKPRSTYISQRLGNLQATVGGYVEIVSVPRMPGLAIICDEEGRIKEDPQFNCHLGFSDFYGTIIFIGISLLSKTGLTDVPMSWDDFKTTFPQLFEEV